jgi:hypothetical protein
MQGLRSVTPLVHSYVAAQAASVAHAYDATGPQTIETDATTDTPEVYARYPVDSLPYFAGMTNAVRRPLGVPATYNYHNQDDFALGAWLINQDTKPDAYWDYSKSTKRWYSASWVTFPAGVKRPTTPLYFPGNRYEIYAHIAEPRSYALGAAERGGFIVRGQIARQVNLNVAPFDYKTGSHEHSAQFLSTIHRRTSFWRQLLESMEVVP